MDSGDESISALTAQTTEGFTRLISVLRTSTASDVSNLSEANIVDAYERLQLWSGNIGAALDPRKRASLEFRLRHAPEIKQQIIDLLRDLLDAINDLYDITTRRRENRKTGIVHLQPGSLPSESIQLRAVDEAQDLFGIILDCVRNLLRLSVIIRKATPRDRFSKALQRTEDPFLDSFDILHVGEKFPKLSSPDKEWLKIRLGRANTQRRHFLRYCRDHSDKMKEPDDDDVTFATIGKEKPKPPPGGTPGGSTTAKQALVPPFGAIAPSTIASTLQLPLLQAGPIEEDDARSEASILSFAEVPEEALLEVPPLQTVSGGNIEFECPYCFGIQSFKRERQWRRHVFADLKAYVCCLGQGECDLQLFGDREAWFTHELECHRYWYKCLLCDREPIRSIEKFRSHVRSKHTVISDGQFTSIARASQQPLDLILASDCPFCDEFDHRLRDAEKALYKGASETEHLDNIMVTSRRFRRHVATHQEQLALFSIFRKHTGEESENSNSAAPRKLSVAGEQDASSEAEIGDTQWLPDPPLHTAAFHCNVEDAERLINEGADVHSRGETWGSVMKAVEHSNATIAQKTSIVKLLVRHGADEAELGEELQRLIAAYEQVEREAHLKPVAESEDHLDKAATRLRAPTITIDTSAVNAKEPEIVESSQTKTCRAIAQYDYEKSEDNEIDMRDGELITDIEKIDEDWWLGKNSQGESGLFPANYVMEVDNAYAHEAKPVTPQPLESQGQRARAEYDYEAAEDNELSFPEDAIITNIGFPDEDWWYGRYKDKEGLFPSNYVKLIEAIEPLPIPTTAVEATPTAGGQDADVSNTQ